MAYLPTYLVGAAAEYNNRWIIIQPEPAMPLLVDHIQRATVDQSESLVVVANKLL